MHIRPVLQKVLHDGHTVVSCSKVEWGGVAAVKVPHVDEVGLGSEDAAHTVNVPRLGRLEELLFCVHARAWWVFCERREEEVVRWV